MCGPVLASVSSFIFPSHLKSLTEKDGVSDHFKNTIRHAIRARNTAYVATAIEIIAAVGLALSIPVTGYVFVACLITQIIAFAYLYKKISSVTKPPEPMRS